MNLPEKQKKVLVFCRENNGITKKQAMGLINDHYHNGQKYVGEVLSRMVNSGLLERVKPGVFQMGSRKMKTVETDTIQLKLF